MALMLPEGMVLRTVTVSPAVHVALKQRERATGIPGPLLIGQMVEEGLKAMAKKKKPAPKVDPKKKSPPKKPKRKK